MLRSKRHGLATAPTGFATDLVLIGGMTNCCAFRLPVGKKAVTPLYNWEQSNVSKHFQAEGIQVVTTQAASVACYGGGLHDNGTPKICMDASQNKEAHCTSVPTSSDDGNTPQLQKKMNVLVPPAIADRPWGAGVPIIH
jgi:uncharacterized Zn-finger protein